MRAAQNVTEVGPDRGNSRVIKHGFVCVDWTRGCERGIRDLLAEGYAGTFSAIEVRQRKGLRRQEKKLDITFVCCLLLHRKSNPRSDEGVNVRSSDLNEGVA